MNESISVMFTLLLYCLYLNQICGVFISVVLKWILKSDSENPLALFFWIILAILGLKYFHINILSSLLVFIQKQSWVSDWSCIESINWCGDNWYFYDTLFYSINFKSLKISLSSINILSFLVAVLHIFFW